MFNQNMFYEIQRVSVFIYSGLSQISSFCPIIIKLRIVPIYTVNTRGFKQGRSSSIGAKMYLYIYLSIYVSIYIYLFIYIIRIGYPTHRQTGRVSCRGASLLKIWVASHFSDCQPKLYFINCRRWSLNKKPYGVEWPKKSKLQLTFCFLVILV